MDRIENVLEMMGISGGGREIQRAQTEHRLKLIDMWKIAPGARVLEVGCGQGDTTAALAMHVGEGGYVLGIDVADGDYGAPETLGEARERLLRSMPDGRLEMLFGTDVRHWETEEKFDYAVLSHCAWYFESTELLGEVLRRLRKLAKRLCFAEWNINARLPEQLAHRDAVLVQAACESFYAETLSNVRTLLTPEEMLEIARQAGWAIEETGSVFSPALQDGSWEIDNALREYPERIRNAQMPDKLRKLLENGLAELEKAKDVLPLDVFAFTARGEKAE